MIGAIDWDGEAFALDGTRFRAGFTAKPEPGEFWITKPREFVDEYVSLVAALRPRQVVELGVYQGGSVAFLSLLTQPTRFVAIDIRPQVPAQLTQWIDAHELSDAVRPYFGVDQADVARLRHIVEAEFAGQPLDLIVDDASHRLGPTRASFNTLFRQLRPGGSMSSRTGARVTTWSVRSWRTRR